MSGPLVTCKCSLCTRLPAQWKPGSWRWFAVLLALIMLLGHFVPQL